ncbi:hypothetical protein Bpfe_007018 [Biomphalaria pfeifferi]|uniref:FLYWCH-type domain-containing protein n=1 Tax=Biomphalaria pfeifferi TaxID=112525 RepID=A0AAD8FFR9_BIOPF|nr:hypothetical protein Bpfe_007018 [Biomphalaria pfeifferi]
MPNLLFQPTQRNGVILNTQDGFCYLRYRTASKQETEYWTCELRPACPARGITRNNRKEFEQTKQHNHLPDALRCEIREVKNNLKRLAADAIGCDTTTNILQTTLMLTSAAAKARLPVVDHIKRNVQRSRNRAQMPMPQSRDEIQIPKQYQLIIPITFLLWDSGPATNDEERILMFGADLNLDFLRSCNAIVMDGTFQCTPQHFLQLYALHGTRMEGDDHKPGQAVSFFFLFPNKSVDTYRRGFNRFKMFLPGWEPQRIMMDFERAIPIVSPR